MLVVTASVLKIYIYLLCTEASSALELLREECPTQIIPTYLLRPRTTGQIGKK